jgi:PII-like signaling protein
MKEESAAKLLRIFIGESDKHEGKTLYEYLVQELRKHHFAGVTVTRGIEGFGQKSLIHSANILDLSTDLPIIIEVVDREERIEEFIKMIDKMELQKEVSMLITEEKVKVIRYGKSHE